MGSLGPPNTTFSPSVADLIPTGAPNYSTDSTDITFMTATKVTTDSEEQVTASLGKRSTAEIVIWSIVLTIILVVAITGNLLVIACVRTTARLRSEKSNMFLVNLSITDVGSACVVMTSSLHAMAADQWHLGSVWCDLVCGANYAFIIVSMLTLCFISLDRYAAVVYALRYQGWVTRRKISLLLAWAWFQGICFGLAPVLAKWVRYDYWEVVCAIVWHEDATNTLTYVIVAFAICFLMPGVILAVAYCKIIKVAKAQNNVHPHNANPRPSVAVIGSDMATSAGATNDRPGLSIISDVQIPSVNYTDPGNGQPKVSTQDDSAACCKNPAFDSMRRQCVNSENQANLLHRNGGQDASSFGHSTENLSAGGVNGFTVLKKRQGENLTQCFDDAVTFKDNACDSNKPPVTPKLNIKAGYPENYLSTLKKNGGFNSLSISVSPCDDEANFETNLSKQETLNQNRQAVHAKDTNDGKSSLLSEGCVQFRNDRPYSAPCSQNDTRKTRLYSETTAVSHIATVARSESCHIRTETMQAWPDDQTQGSNSLTVAVHAPDRCETFRLIDSQSHATPPQLYDAIDSQNQRPSQPSSRRGSSTSCQFTEIPGSPQSLAVPQNGCQPESVSEQPKSSQNKSRNYSTSSKAVKSLLIVVLAFFICMTPFSITKLYKVIFPRPDSLPGYVNLVATIFQYCSSVINPLIYGIFRRDFQKAFLLIFKKLLVKLRLRDSIEMSTDTALVSY
ncbi:histamine H2 receptor [Elysia marginata]|uniref:Histamine H2 receptor n=1 Tax=Elysia marginata TaxID=1093978 RepID=A0AAV4EGL2_9GAST|nr:histamine H2 receptor [Elysia marginata]